MVSSEASKTWRISISYSPPGTGSGQRLIHSIASSFEFTWNIQNPAISSLSSGNGPSITVRLPAENLTRVPFELGCRPSPASNPPAFVSSSLYFNHSGNQFRARRNTCLGILVGLEQDHEPHR